MNTETLIANPVDSLTPVKIKYRWIPEIAVRTLREDGVNQEEVQVTNATLAVKFFRDVVEKSEWFDPDKEHLVVLLQDRKNRVKAWNLISIGSLAGTVAHPREIFRAACVYGASGITLIHNHPSGDPAPSSADATLTRQIREAAKILEFTFLDHVVVGRTEFDPTGKGYYSFREAGVI